jgi:hypothetical protein
MTIRISFSDKTVRVAVEINGAIESLITELPQREWVGLTDDEFNELYDSYVPTACYALLIEEVEAKLKEKNNG